MGDEDLSSGWSGEASISISFWEEEVRSLEVEEETDLEGGCLVVVVV